MVKKKQSSPVKSASRSSTKPLRKGVSGGETEEMLDIHKPEEWNVLGRRGVLPPATICEGRLTNTLPGYEKMRLHADAGGYKTPSPPPSPFSEDSDYPYARRRPTSLPAGHETATAFFGEPKNVYDGTYPHFYVKGFHVELSLDKWIYKKLGRTHMMVTRLSLGSGTFGGLYGECDDDVTAIVLHALRHGLTLVDTGFWLTLNRVEQHLCQAFRRVPARRAFHVIINIGFGDLDYGHPVMEYSREAVQKQVYQKSDFCCAEHTIKGHALTVAPWSGKVLRRFGVIAADHQYVCERCDLTTSRHQVHDHCHAPSSRQLCRVTLPALAEERKRGRVKAVGLRGYSVEQMARIVRDADAWRCRIDVVVVHARGNLADSSLGEYMDIFQVRGIAVINACAIGMGLLFLRA